MNLQTILWTLITVSSLLILGVEMTARYIYKTREKNNDTRN